MIKRSYLGIVKAIRFKGFSRSVINSFPHDIFHIVWGIPSLHFILILKEFMKNKNHSEGIYLFKQTDFEPLVNFKGRVTQVNKFNSDFKVNHLKDETAFIIDLQNGVLSNQISLCELLDYCKEPKSLDDLKKMCHKNHLSHVKHICKTYIDYCQKHLLIQDQSSLSLTFKMQKSNGSFIKIFCQISVWESHENQLTKLMIKFTDIDFIASDCDLTWALQSNTEDRLKFKNLVAAKYITTFSVRELDIVKEICTGLSNIQIGKKLFISNHTVATHRKNIYKKSNCKNVASLISFCRQKGLI